MAYARHLQCEVALKFIPGTLADRHSFVGNDQVCSNVAGDTSHLVLIIQVLFISGSHLMSNSDYSWRSLWEIISTVRGLSLGSHSSTEDLGIGVVYH